MSSIYIEIGQAGCQIGKKLNEKLTNSYYSTRIHGQSKVHAIMMDTQPKVLKPIIDNPPKWIDTNNIKYFQYGRGNNWSYGYMHQLPQKNKKLESSQLSSLNLFYEQNIFEQKKEYNKQELQFITGHKQFSHLPVLPSEHEQQDQHKPIKKTKTGFFKSQQKNQPHYSKFEQQVLIKKYLKENKQISEYALDRIRKQLDHSDCPLCINVICSLGGGTGSGLGTKLLEKIYEQFSIDTYAHVILPNKSGQTPLQIYNCSLSLASIQQHSTAIFPYENDNMINMFLDGQSSLISKTSTNQPPNKPQKLGSDLQMINNQIAKMQARLFKVNDIDGYGRFYTDLVSDCIASNQLKYVSLFGSSIKDGTNGYQFDECYEQLCNQLRIFNEDIYQIQGIEPRRGKCISSSMLISSPTLPKSKVQQPFIKQHHVKKLKALINPLHSANFKEFNNIEEINYPTKSNKNTKKSDNKAQILFIMNHSNIVRYLEYLSLSGRKKLASKAYLWHYQYADLNSAFQSLETVSDQYHYFSK